MPPLFSLKNITLRYGARTILDAISLSFSDERRIALIGRNGVGKTTLCRIITGEEEPDSGEVYRHSSLRLGLLRQEENFLSEESVVAYLHRESGAEEWRCGELAHKFAIRKEVQEMPMASLSGGWRMRAKLVAMLLREPNFLVLDEPTNFLDLRTQFLLQRFFTSFKGGALVISHDRAFLDATCPYTLELSHAKISYSPLKASEHVKKREEEKEYQRRANTAKLAKREQLETFITRFRAKSTLAAQAKSKQKQLDKIVLEDIPVEESRVHLRLPDVAPFRKTVMACTDMTIGYQTEDAAGKVIAKDIGISLEPGERLVAVGDNGEGKTTLLKTISGMLPPLAGRYVWNYHAKIGVYAQHVYESLPQQGTVKDYLTEKSAGAFTEKEVLTLAGGFLFRGEDVNKRVHVLSGGERARLCLAGLFLSGCNVLILDEPSNHLDAETSEALAAALCAYQGSVILVCHERLFAERVATKTVELKSGNARALNGGFAEYCRSIEVEADGVWQVKSEKETLSVASVGEDLCVEVLTGKERFMFGKRLEALERKIARLDKELEEMVDQMECAGADWQRAAALQATEKAKRQEKEDCEWEWLEISEKMGK